MEVTATAPAFAVVRNILGVLALPPILLLLAALVGAGWLGAADVSAVRWRCSASP